MAQTLRGKTVFSQADYHNRANLKTSVMETTQSLAFDCTKLATVQLIYDHVSTHFKNAVIQVSGFQEEAPSLSAIGTLGGGGLIMLELKKNNIQSWNNFMEPKTTPSTLCMRNQSVDRAVLLSKLLFSNTLNEVKVKFYKRSYKPEPEFVEFDFEFQDDVTRTLHCTALQPNIPPTMKSLKKSSVTGKVLLSHKTVTNLIKWLKDIQKAFRGEQVIKVSLEAELYVITFVVEGHCKTVEFKPLEQKPLESFLGPLSKATDCASVLNSMKCHVDLKSFTSALMTCKIPGKTLPLLQFLDSGILQISAAPLVASAHVEAELLVVLHPQQPESDTGSRPLQTEDADCGQNSAPEDVSNRDLSEKKTCIKECYISDSEEEADQHKPVTTTPPLVPEAQKSGRVHKRPKTDKDHKRHAKKIKLNFNPLV